ncbi:TPA: hypothetical protein RXU73_003029 [Yersinia enterocolitica]|nr:hypothetical protein [Yersinia enterocolitica]
MLSKEQLEKIANQGPVDIGGAQNPIVTEMATELLSLREQLAAINGAQEPVGFVKCDPCAEDCRWDCVDPIYLAGSVTPDGYGSDYFEVYRHPAPLKE